VTTSLPLMSVGALPGWKFTAEGLLSAMIVSHVESSTTEYSEETGKGVVCDEALN
jgi:hypothetical protein